MSVYQVEEYCIHICTKSEMTDEQVETIKNLVNKEGLTPNIELDSITVETFYSEFEAVGVLETINECLADLGIEVEE